MPEKAIRTLELFEVALLDGGVRLVFPECPRIGVSVKGVLKRNDWVVDVVEVRRPVLLGE